MTQNTFVALDEVGKQTGARTLTTQLTLAGICAVLLVVVPQTSTAYSLTTFKKVAPEIAVKADQKYGEMIDIAALLHDYDEDMILAVMVVESEGKNTALSHKGAQGLMQLMPLTAKAMGATDPHEPFQNILAGTKYLKELERRYKFGRKEALVAYNMGPTKAKRWLSEYRAEDSLYVQKVMSLYDHLAAEREIERKQAQKETAIESVGILTKPKSISLASPSSLGNQRRGEVVEEE